MSLRGVTVTVMQNTRSPVSRSQLLQLYAVNIAVGAMLALGVALPVMGLAFMLTLVPSCLTTTGCDTPTAFDALVPVAGLGTWIAVTTTFAALQVHSLRRVARRRPSRKLHIR